MTFNIIACVNNNMLIGKNGDLLYHIKNDLQNLRRMTLGSVVIYGRKTLESLPQGKPLDGRTNIVITRDTKYHVENAIVVNSIIEAIDVAKEIGVEEAFVLGGGEIYHQFMQLDIIDNIYLTEVIDNKEGDTYFPKIDKEKYKLFYKSETQFHQPPYSFSIYRKVK